MTTSGSHEAASGPTLSDGSLFGRRAPGAPRGPVTIAYVAATVLGGAGALVILVMTMTAPDASGLDILVWAALAVMLFGSAAYRWWRGGQREERSRIAAAGVSSHELASALARSASDAEAVRRLRRGHPGLGLIDAVDLVRRERGDGRPGGG